MLFLIVIGLVIWGIVALVQHKKKKREQARIRAEMDRMRAKTKATSARVSALEKEQTRLAAESQKHAEQIAKLEFKMEQAVGDIEHITEQLGDLYALLDVAENQRMMAVPGSKADISAQNKIISLKNRIRTAEKRLDKAKFDKAEAERKLA